MRTWALIGLMLMGCDGKESEGEPPADTTPPADTETEETTADTKDTDDTIPPDDTGSDAEDTGSDTADDTAVVESDPCEGREVGNEVGQCAIDFTLLDQNGDEQTLYDYAGKIVFLDFSGFT